MSNFNWSPWLGNNSYVLDVITGSGTAQLFLGLSYGTQDPTGTGLTAGDSNGTAAAMKTSVDSLSGVTGSTLTSFVPPGLNGSGYLLFDSGVYSNRQFDIAIPDNFNSPDHIFCFMVADSSLSSGDLSTVAADVRTYMLGMANVVSVSVSQLTVTPATL